ncbi:MAG: DUF2608 domain-containing protein [Xanthomonadales bacterium]
MPGPVRRYLLLLALPLLLAACATPTPQEAPRSTRGATDDLGLIADLALGLAERHGAANVLVVLDIDNTILAMEQDLGSDQWYYWQKDLAGQNPCDPALVSDRLAVQGALFFASAMRPTQPDAAAQVARMQSAGLPVIALTSRGPDYRLQTFRELRRNGFSFWSSALPPRGGWAGAFVPAGGERPALYEDGVFLTAGQHKGRMLQALLDRTGVPTPVAILIADDKQDNHDAIRETFGDSGTGVHVWRYTREDPVVAAFDGAAADAQWNTLRPALKVIEDVLGPDNYDLPDSPRPPGCDTP